MTKIRRCVAAYDLHFPKYHKPTVAALFDYLKKNPPDIFIFGGDQLDLECISHHTANMPLYRVRNGFAADMAGFQKHILDPLEELLPKTCEKIWITGNHERFQWDLIERHPELEGTVDYAKMLQLDKRGWQQIPLGHAYKLGKLTVVHGEILSGIGNQGGAFPAKKAVEMYAGNVLAGHSHSPQTFTKVSPVEHTNKWQGHIAPVLGSTNPTYLRNRPTAWLNGFVLVDVFPTGQFNLYSVISVNGQFSFAGQVYGK